MDNVVYAAIRKEPAGSSTIGYFLTQKDVPDGWELCEPPQQDVSDIMSRNNWTIQQALQMMNCHWQ